MAQTSPDHLFISNGGAMGRSIASHDWSSHPLGGVDGWSPALRTSLSMILGSGFPSYVAWSEAFYVFYNDAYAPILGNKVGLGQGRPLAELWSEVAETACSIARQAFAGEATYFEDMPFLLDRHGHPEQAYFTFSCSPIRDEYGVIQGVLGTVHETTEKVIALAQHRAGEERYRLALDASGNIGTWTVDPQTSITMMDEGFARLFQVDPAVAQSGTGIEHFLNKIHSEDRPRVLAAIAQAIETGGSYDMEYRIQQQSGGASWIAAKGKMYADAQTGKKRFAGVAVDISQRKKMEEALRETQARLSAVFEILPIGIAVVDAQGTVVLSNLAMHQYLPTSVLPSLDDSRHRRWRAHHTDGRPYAREEFPAARALRGERVVPGIEILYMQDDGNEIWTQVAAVPIRDGSGQVTGQVAVVTNIDAFKRTEAALRLSEEKYRTLYDEMARSNRNLSEFLAVLAHELRNPLAPILTGLELMRMRPDNPETVARVREMIERQASQMVHLINDLLDIARVTNGKIEIKKTLVNLNSLIAIAIETSLPAIDSARHELSVQLGEKPLWLKADGVRVAQMVSNLLTNAAKYTPQGGKINVTVEQDMDEAIVSVSDNGIGIPPESLSLIFEMFGQVRRNLPHSQGGLGIGLALVHNLAQLHGGTVTATSEGAGKGSTFIVRLPLDRASARLGDDASPLMNTASPAGKALRILVADDNTDAALSLSALLRMYGHDTRIAHDGLQALQIADAYQPEIAFLDIGMQGMTGYDVARKLKATEALKGMRIVAVTGWGSEEDRVRSKDAGFDRHFTKPLSPATVIQLLDDMQ